MVGPRPGSWGRAVAGARGRISALVASDAFPPFRLNIHPWSPLFLVLLGAAVLAAALGIVAAVWMVVLTPPSIPKAPRPTAVAQTSRIFAADGSVLATIHGEINREPIPLTDMPRTLWQAAVAAEDERFFRHEGVDARALVRAALANAIAGAPVQGGSTITQQYVKSAYVGRERTVVRKMREALLARRLERELSKRQILERYLNTVYFGRGAYGVQAAANAYFGKPASQLTLSESAMLVGLIPAPAALSPDRNPSASQRRRGTVIERMEAAGFLDSETARRGIRDKPQVVALREEAPRFPWFTDAVRSYLFNRYGVDKVLTGGLQVRTTLDPGMQQAAEGAIRHAVPNPEDPHAALAAVDPETGYVRALVGGREWGPERFNIATLGRRQPGSAFKPFVLVGALEEGMSPTATTYPGPRSLCLRGWTPGCVHNFGSAGFGRLSLEEATVHSVNTVYAQLVLDVGPKRVVDVARRMGIPAPGSLVPEMSGCRPQGTPACRTHLRPKPALALGSQEVTPLEMASAYATLAAGGMYRQPKVVEEVVDRSGRVLERGPSRAKRAIGENVAATTTQILQEAVAHGTGQRANIGPGAAGKTGTAQDFRNAWFVGYTPTMASAVWMGYRDSNRPLLDVHGVRQVTGGSIPASIWAESMTAVDLAVSEPDRQARHLLGGEAAYRLELANLGPWEAPQVTLVDRLPEQVTPVSATPTVGTCRMEGGVVTCDIGDLPKGQKAAVDVVVRPKEAGTFVHTATVASARGDADAGNNAVETPIVVEPAADLSVLAGAAGVRALVGQELPYRVEVRNAGPSNASRVVVSTRLPRDARFVDATPSQGSCRRRGVEVTCSFGDVGVGAGAGATIVVVPSRAGPLTAAVRAAAAEADPRADDNGLGSKVEVEPAADLRIEGRVLTKQVVVEQPLVYVLRLHNAGPSPATGVTVTSGLPVGMLVRSAAPTRGDCRTSSQGLVCELGDVDEGGIATIRLTAVPTIAGEARISTHVKGREADPDPAHDVAEARATVLPSADLSVEVRAPRQAFVGEQATYEIRVDNSGPSEASRVEVTAEIPRELGFSTASSDAPACTMVGDRVHCSLGNLGPRSHATVRLLLRGSVAGQASLGVAAAAEEVDPRNADNESKSETTVLEGSSRGPNMLASRASPGLGADQPPGHRRPTRIRSG